MGLEMDQQVSDQVVDWIRTRFFGKYRGLVMDNQDPTNRGRIKVKVPAVLEDQQVWAMPCVTYAGDNIGFYATPKAGSGCWVEFEGGDPSYPLVTGYFWADNELPKNENGVSATPPMKIVRTEQGLMLSMDDGGQTISVSDENGNNILKIEVSPGKITVKGATKAVVEAPLIELVENSTHPVVFGDELLRYLQQLELTYNTHMHPGQLAAGVVPVTPMPPTPMVTSPATPALYSTRVTTG